MVECRPSKSEAVGSNPIYRSQAVIAQLVERDLAKVKVAGSRPVCCSYAPVDKLVKSLAFHASGRGFEPHQEYIRNHGRIGYDSTLSRCEIAGSSPVGSANQLHTTRA